MTTAHFKLTAIDETEYWRKDITDATGSIKTVYLYDELKSVNLCELQSSYELTPLYYVTEHYVDDRINELMMESLAGDSQIYAHCHQVKPIYDLGEESHDEDYDAVLSSRIEYETCNHRDFVVKPRMVM